MRALDFVGDTVVSVHMALGNYSDEKSAGMRAARARIEAKRGIGGELPPHGVGSSVHL